MRNKLDKNTKKIKRTGEIGSAMLVVGSISDGFSFYGPFPDEDNALAHAMRLKAVGIIDLTFDTYTVETLHGKDYLNTRYPPESLPPDPVTWGVAPPVVYTSWVKEDSAA